MLSATHAMVIYRLWYHKRIHRGRICDSWCLGRVCISNARTEPKDKQQKLCTQHTETSKEWLVYTKPRNMAAHKYTHNILIMPSITTTSFTLFFANSVATLTVCAERVSLTAHICSASAVLSVPLSFVASIACSCSPKAAHQTTRRLIIQLLLPLLRIAF